MFVNIRSLFNRSTFARSTRIIETDFKSGMFIITKQRNDSGLTSTSPTFCCTPVVPFVPLVNSREKKRKKYQKIKKPPKWRPYKRFKGVLNQYPTYSRSAIRFLLVKIGCTRFYCGNTCSKQGSEK